jgi:hypothetical protein
LRTLDRISRLFRLLVESYELPVPLKILQERLDDAASATIKRDIRFLRDSMGMPIIYDQRANGYYIAKDEFNKHIGFSIPGLWISAEEGYAFLTLYNVLRKIDPGVVGPLIEPLRSILKRVLSDRHVPMYGLDHKIRVELDQPAIDVRTVLNNLSHALAANSDVTLAFFEGSKLKDGAYVLDHLTLKVKGWFLTAMPKVDQANLVEIPVQEIRACIVNDLNREGPLSSAPLRAPPATGGR